MDMRMEKDILIGMAVMEIWVRTPIHQLMMAVMIICRGISGLVENIL